MSDVQKLKKLFAGITNETVGYMVKCKLTNMEKTTRLDADLAIDNYLLMDLVSKNARPCHKTAKTR